MALNSLKALLFSILFFFWTASFFWPSVGVPWIARVIEAIWLMLVIWYLFNDLQYRILFKKILPVLLLLIILLAVSYFLDADAIFKDILYIKTLGYVVLAVAAGCLLGLALVVGQIGNRVFIRDSAWIASGLIIGYFIYSLNIGWMPGELLLRTSLAEYYQGMSRLIVVSILIIVAARRYIPLFLQIVCLVLGSLLAVSFLGGGALIGLALAIVWLTLSAFREPKPLRNRIIGSTLILAIFVTAGIKRFDLDDVLFAYQKRITSKFVIQDNSTRKEGRVWLMTQGVNLWLNTPISTIVGIGPVKYSKNIGYEDEFRHPHNIIILTFVWFGLLSAPFLLAASRCVWKARLLLKNRSEVGDYAIVLFIYYSAMAMLGGDFEQNRHFFFIYSFVFTFSSLYKRTSNSIRYHMIER